MDQDSFARASARRAIAVTKELKQDMAALWTRVGVVEEKTANLPYSGRCLLCGWPTQGRYCHACDWIDEQ